MNITKKNKLDKHKSSNNLELNNYNDESKDNFNNLKQNDYFNTELKSSNTIINKIKNKKKIELKNISYCKYKKFVIFIK